MMNQDLLILQTARDWLRSGYQIVLVTVAQTWGSSPRPAGSLMALLAQIAMSLDFAVTVCDPRQEYYDEWNGPGATLVRTMPDHHAR